MHDDFPWFAGGVFSHQDAHCHRDDYILHSLSGCERYGPSVVVEIFTSKMYNNFILLAVPLFIFAANIMNSSKVTDKVFDFPKSWWGGGRAAWDM